MIQFPEFPASNNCCAYSAEGNTQPAHRFVRQRDLANTGERGRGGAHDAVSHHARGRQVGTAAHTPFISAPSVVLPTTVSSLTRAVGARQ
jgi:hypothetical protein